MLEKLGPTFIKLGQALSIRPDVVRGRFVCVCIAGVLSCRVPYRTPEPHPTNPAAPIDIDTNPNPPPLNQVGPAATEELQKLQDAVPPFPNEVAFQVRRPIRLCAGFVVNGGLRRACVVACVGHPAAAMEQHGTSAL